jgi:uncharacterized protein (TIGR01370 family)
VTSRLKQLFTALVCFVGSGCTPMVKASLNTPTPPKERWAVYYDKQLPAKAFKDYGLVVFDRIYYPEFEELKPDTTVLAYISLGEVHGDTDEHALLEKQHALLGKRSKWNSYTVDLTSKTWAKIIDAQVADAMDKGFDGIMLDTIDSGLHLADMDSPEKGERAQEAAIKIITDLRQHYPDMKIMLNRGFEILPRVANVIDYALGESMLANTDISTGQSSLFPANTYQSIASRLTNARAIAPKLKLYTLDYWNPEDVEGMQKLYAIHRTRGFTPYITTPDLRRHTPEPTGLFQTTTSPSRLEAPHA